MNIGIITNLEKDKDLLVTKKIIKWLEERNVKVIFDEKMCLQLEITKDKFCNKDIFRNSDIVIVLGGDGTLLNVARQAICTEVPLFGVNLGHLGFLTEIEVSEMYLALEKILNGEFTIEKRMMLEAFIEKNKEKKNNFIALNDITISKGSFSRLVTYSIYINDKYVDLYSADGIIISSPTGSTAYSLSAGGPIVSPNLELLLITPVCPHALHSRSILVSGDDHARIEVCKSNYTNIIMTVDGQDGITIKPGDIVTVTKSRSYANLIKLNNNKSFFDVLRDKLAERWYQK